MQNIDNILRSRCRSVVVFRVGLEGTLHDCDEHSVPSGRFLSRGSRAAMGQGAAMRVRAALANGLRLQDRRMAAAFGIHLNLGREAVDMCSNMCCLNLWILIVSVILIMLLLIFCIIRFRIWCMNILNIFSNHVYLIDDYIDYCFV